jgi:P-type Ca2+ transporter type 2C
MSEITPTELLQLVDPKSTTYLKELGGVLGVVEKLHSDTNTGLKYEQVLHNTEIYGTNTLPEPISKSFLQFVWEALQDKTLIVLMVAAAVELALGVYKFKFAPEDERESAALLDGGAVLVAGK